MIHSRLSLPWSISACPSNHHLDASGDALTRSAAAPHGCSLWPHAKQPWLCLLPPVKSDGEEPILTCPSIVPPFRKDHLADTFLSLALKAFLLSASSWPHQSVFGVSITPQLGTFGPAVLFFHYFTGTVALFFFQSSVSPKIPLTIASWNAGTPPAPASPFPLLASSCPGRDAAPLHLLSVRLKHICSLFSPKCQD